MTLGNVISVSDQGQKPKLKRVRRCLVPQLASATLIVTYAAGS